MAESKNKIPPTRLTVDDLPDLSPLSIQWLGEEIELNGFQPGGRIRIRLPKYNLSRTFVFEYKKDWTARPFSAAIAQAKQYAQVTDDLPLVIVPYMSDQHLDVLYEAEISGMDLCGNAFLLDRKMPLLRFSGKPNRFKNTQLVKSPYQGKAALVARTLLSCPVLPNAEALRAEVEKRGGAVSQPMVSRALKAFRDDLIVGKQGDYDIVLLQPEKMLDRLAKQWKVTVEQWQKSGQTVLWRGRVQGDRNEYLQEIFRNAREAQETIMFTGLDAAVIDMNMATELTRYIYASRTEKLLDNLEVQPTRRFPNLEILTPPDEAVFLDSRVLAGIRWPSQLQSYLELITDDARLQQGAKEMRKAILELIAGQKATLLKSKDTE